MAKLIAKHTMLNYKKDEMGFVDTTDEYEKPIDLVMGDFRLWVRIGDSYDSVIYKDKKIDMGNNDMDFEQCADFIQKQMDAIDNQD